MGLTTLEMISKERERARKREVVRSTNQNDLSTEHNPSGQSAKERDDQQLSAARLQSWPGVLPKSTMATKRFP